MADSVLLSHERYIYNQILYNIQDLQIFFSTKGDKEKEILLKLPI